LTNNQKTLNKSLEFEGVGLHTGDKVSMTIDPAKTNHGIKFQRLDLPGKPVIPADIDFVSDTKRSTTLEKDNVKVVTVEHLMSALYALGVNNALVKLNSSEIPILDGSSKYYVEGIQKVGLKTQDAPLKYVNLPNPIQYKDPDTGSEILFIPADNFIISVVLDYDNPALGTMYAEIRDLEDYPKEIATCKTFVFLTELEKLAKANLIKGGGLENAIVVIDRKNTNISEIKKLAHLLGKDNHDIQINGTILNNCELQFSNEPARHKLLDVIGDLALIGCQLKVILSPKTRT